MADTSLTSLFPSLNKPGAFNLPGAMQGPTQTMDTSKMGNGISLSNTGLPSTSSILPTSTGGMSFHPSVASGYTAPSQTTPQVSKAPVGTLADYTYNNTQSPNGGTLQMNQSGNPTSFNPNYGFQISTGGSVPSTALNQNMTTSDLMQKHSQYSDYVNALAKAQGYSPQYIQAYGQQQQAQLGGAQLGLNSAQLNSNLYTGNNLPGDTMQYAQGATAKAQAQNTLEQAQNSIQQLGANQALNTAQLARTGDIASAQTQLQYNPTAISSQNAINQYNSLQQQYPNAGIPAFDPQGDPLAQQQMAQQLVQNSPAYQAQFQGTYTTPGGGLGTYSKLNPGGSSQEIVSGADAASGSADASSLAQQQQYYDTTNRAYTTATSNLSTLQNFMQQNNLNSSDLPIIQQITNKFKGQTNQAGVIAAFNSSLEGLRSEYAQVLSRGGSVTDTERKSANTLIPDNLNPSQLQVVTKQLQLEGENALHESSNQVNAIKSRLGGGQSNSSNSSSTGWY